KASRDKGHFCIAAAKVNAAVEVGLRLYFWACPFATLRVGLFAPSCSLRVTGFPLLSLTRAICQDDAPPFHAVILGIFGTTRTNPYLLTCQPISLPPLMHLRLAVQTDCPRLL